MKPREIRKVYKCTNCGHVNAYDVPLHVVEIPCINCPQWKVLEDNPITIERMDFYPYTGKYLVTRPIDGRIDPEYDIFDTELLAVQFVGSL